MPLVREWALIPLEIGFGIIDIRAAVLAAGATLIMIIVGTRSSMQPVNAGFVTRRAFPYATEFASEHIAAFCEASAFYCCRA